MEEELEEVSKGVKTTQRKMAAFSGGDLVRYFMLYDSYDEMASHAAAEVRELLHHMQGLTACMENLFKEYAIPCAMSGINIDFTVKSGQKVLLQTRMGDADSSDRLKEFMSEIAEAL